MKIRIIHLALILVLTSFLSIDRSSAETINITLNGDAVCDDPTLLTDCEIINITPNTFATGAPGDSFVFDIIINNMNEIKLGSDVFFGLQYELNTTGLQGTGGVKFTQQYALSNENGDLITNIIDLPNIFFILEPGLMNHIIISVNSIPQFNNKTFNDVHSIVNTETVEGELAGTFEISVLGVLLTSDSATVIGPSVPTLSQWGLIAMAGVLGIVGFIVIRRREIAA